MKNEKRLINANDLLYRRADVNETGIQTEAVGSVEYVTRADVEAMATDERVPEDVYLDNRYRYVSIDEIASVFDRGVKCGVMFMRTALRCADKRFDALPDADVLNEAVELSCYGDADRTNRYAYGALKKAIAQIVGSGAEG